MWPKVFPRHVSRWSIFLAALLVGVPPLDVARAQSTAVAASSPAAWVGAAACATCHGKEYQAWQTSQHALAMQVADDKSVLGDFNRARYSYAGVTSTFFRRDGKFYVHTDGPDGKLADFELLYTFGVTPLQQYLIALPGGRLQAFGIAWDSRPKAQGGERWFHLYPGLKLKAGNPLHWTGIDQNWNYQCAECHSTHFEKNYDAGKKAFDSRWSEINVSCESCHGPGQQHLAWAKGSRQANGDMGLVATLDERRGVYWAPDPQSGQPMRSSARSGNREIDVCARCHARRGQFAEAFVHGQTLSDAYRPATLDPGLYWPDGQMRDEVYNYGPFLQSRMHAAGVTCSDCHEPHSQKLRAPGDGVCGQCHVAAKYTASSHHHHAENSPGSRCADCHMPTTTYMQVDPRHDHSFRIPRPDQSVKLGVPNACNQCHVRKTPEWAATSIRKWTSRPPGGFQRFAEALHNATSATLPANDVVAGLAVVAGDATHPAIARATALARLADYPTAAAIGSARRSLTDPDAMVREAAVNTFSHADASQRARLLAPLLRDRVRGVRLAATRALAGASESLLGIEDQKTFRMALAEYIAAQNFNADRPESHADLGSLHAERGEMVAAEREFRTAIELDPNYLLASINLADLFRSLGREADVEATMRQALTHAPRTAMLHHVLGLSLVRQKRMKEALAELRRASILDRDDMRFAYVYAVALHDAGKPAEAIRLLKQSIRRAPGNAMLRQALLSFEGR
ncbi:MAG: multiheme c-type cytochrome [Sterolibacterium sp.]|jgi:tetratricopeptide (TPR) repeat protein/cytochrome c553